MPVTPIVSPDRITVPPTVCALCAWTVPAMLTTPPTTPAALPASIRTMPPSAITLPSLPALPETVAAVPVSNAISPSPARSRVKVACPPSVTAPSRAVIVPVLPTCPPTSATSPASATVIAPALVTLAPPFAEGWLNASLPAMKSASAMSAVVATRPPTLTCAPAPNSTPLGLTMKTRPLAVIDPSIREASVAPTRLSVTALASGCANVTLCPAPTSNPCQLMIARALAWSIRVAPGFAVIVAVPAATMPPIGSANAGVATARPSAVPTIRVRRSGRERRVMGYSIDQ